MCKIGQIWTKVTVNVYFAEKLIAQFDEIQETFWATKK